MDKKQKDELILSHLEKCNILSSIFINTHDNCETFEDDIRSEGYYALVRAADKFDINQGVAFWSYAEPSIKGRLQNYYNKETRGNIFPSDPVLIETNANSYEVAPGLEKKDEDDQVGAVMHKVLSERNLAILRGYLEHGLTLKELGVGFNLSKSRIDQIIKESIVKVKKALAERAEARAF